jgi:hypothetical protein
MSLLVIERNRLFVSNSQQHDVHKIATLLKTACGNIPAALEFLMKTSHLLNT